MRKPPLQSSCPLLILGTTMVGAQSLPWRRSTTSLITLNHRQSKLRHVFGSAEIIRRGETVPIKGANGNKIAGSYLTDVIAATTSARILMYNLSLEGSKISRITR
jgi:hypothetical protein